MSKILTVTIPSYNTEKYIDECLPYLIDERIISDIEILIVSDGSIDNTVSVAQKWADKYPDSIRVIDKENGGHGSTINRGILEATGKYFKVVDGDDWVVTENFVKLIEFLKGVDVDLINNPYFEHDEETADETLMMALKIQANQIVQHDKIIEQIKIPPMHTITYRTSILKDNKISIDEKMFYVDVAANLERRVDARAENDRSELSGLAGRIMHRQGDFRRSQIGRQIQWKVNLRAGACP